MESEDPNTPLETLLTWLDPEREKAWQKYQKIQETLIKIFTWRKCRNVEDLTNEVINRVEEKVSGLIHTYKGDPARYFYGVAQNVIHEYWREEKRSAEISENYASSADVWRISNDDPNIMSVRRKCLAYCLSTLSESDREIILRYYQSDRKDKLADRKRLAQELGVTMNALWIRTSRIRSVLAECISERLKLEEPFQ